MKRLALLGAAIAAVLLQLSPAGACGNDALMADLAPAHPRSIEVALAVRDAIDRGELRVLSPIAPQPGLERATAVLQDFRPLVPAVAGAPEASLAVLLVDSGLWSRFSATADGVGIEVDVTGPREGEPVVVTSEAALRALVDGALPAKRAAELGVFIVVREL